MSMVTYRDRAAIVVGTDGPAGPSQRLRLWSYDRDGCGESISNVDPADVVARTFSAPEAPAPAEPTPPQEPTP